MYELFLQAVPSVENIGNAKEWIYYIVTLLASYSLSATIVIKFLYKRNISLHEKYENVYPGFLAEQKTFYNLYIDTSEKLADVIKNNSLALQSMEMTTKNNMVRIEGLTKAIQEQSEKTLTTLDKLTEKIIQATHEHT